MQNTHVTTLLQVAVGCRLQVTQVSHWDQTATELANLLEGYPDALVCIYYPLITPHPHSTRDDNNLTEILISEGDFDVGHDFEGPRAPKAHLDTVLISTFT